MEGQSLLPAFAGRTWERSPPLFFEHENSRAVRAGKWKLVSLSGDAWELYDLENDPTEMRDLAAANPDQLRALAAQWAAWAARCHVDSADGAERKKAAAESRPSPETPQIANRPIRVQCEVEPQGPSGVILAQGGRQHGYALHLEDGCPVFSVRINAQVVSVKAPPAPKGRFALEATLAKDGAMRLWINGKEVARGNAPGLIPVQPQDELSVGEDSRTAVGDYQAPHPLKGKVENVKVVTE
jgi:arylsulfatase